MSMTMDEEIKRWTAKRKSALVLDIIQGKTTISEASRQFDLPPPVMMANPSPFPDLYTPPAVKEDDLKSLSGIS